MNVKDGSLGAKVEIVTIYD